MGYYTQYNLSIVCDLNAEMGVDKPYSIQQMLDWCKTNYDDNGCLRAVLSAMEEGYACDDMKWYEHDKDMKALSSAFPNVLFCLDGKGEDDDDLWRSYFLNGKRQLCRAKITIEYPEFDPSFLE